MGHRLSIILLRSTSSKTRILDEQLAMSLRVGDFIEIGGKTDAVLKKSNKVQKRPQTGEERCLERASMATARRLQAPSIVI